MPGRHEKPYVEVAHCRDSDGAPISAKTLPDLLLPEADSLRAFSPAAPGFVDEKDAFCA